MLPGPLKGSCPCGCGVFGTLHGDKMVRGCTGPRGRGSDNRKQGLRRQAKAARSVGINVSNIRPGNEERWPDQIFANEVKSGKQCGPAFTLWCTIEAQVRANAPDFGGRERKPARAILMPNDFGGDGLVIVRLSTWSTTIQPAIEAYYG